MVFQWPLNVQNACLFAFYAIKYESEWKVVIMLDLDSKNNKKNLYGVVHEITFSYEVWFLETLKMNTENQSLIFIYWKRTFSNQILYGFGTYANIHVIIVLWFIFYKILFIITLLQLSINFWCEVTDSSSKLIELTPSVIGTLNFFIIIIFSIIITKYFQYIQHVGYLK